MYIGSGSTSSPSSSGGSSDDRGARGRISSGALWRTVKYWSSNLIPTVMPIMYLLVIVYVLNVGTHSASLTSLKLVVKDLVLLNGITLFMSVFAMQLTCFETTSSGCVRVWPHIVVEYVEIVTDSESMMHSACASFKGSRVFNKEILNGMCCPGAIFSG